LKLIGQRQRRTHNSWFHNVESFVKKEKTNYVSINPADAKSLNIKDNDIVEVKNRFGRIEIPAIITDEVMSGVVAIPHGWGHDKPSGLTVARRYPGVNVNKITAAGAGNLEKFAGMAKLTGVRVSIKKV
jgi:anaerobic selenocysteine-containing dehydrogenase